MNLYCKCGNKLEEFDLILDTSETWCRICFSTSQVLINEWEEKDEFNNDLGDDHGV
jgi:hypothetical protein